MIRSIEDMARRVERGIDSSLNGKNGSPLFRLIRKVRRLISRFRGKLQTITPSPAQLIKGICRVAFDKTIPWGKNDSAAPSYFYVTVSLDAYNAYYGLDRDHACHRIERAVKEVLQKPTYDIHIDPTVMLDYDNLKNDRHGYDVKVFFDEAQFQQYANSRNIQAAYSNDHTIMHDYYDTTDTELDTRPKEMTKGEATVESHEADWESTICDSSSTCEISVHNEQQKDLADVSAENTQISDTTTEIEDMECERTTEDIRDSITQHADLQTEPQHSARIFVGKKPLSVHDGYSIGIVRRNDEKLPNIIVPYKLDERLRRYVSQIHGIFHYRNKHWVFEQIGKEGTRIIQPSDEEKYLHKNDAITLRDKSELYLAGSFLPLIFRTNTGDGTILTPYYREDEVEVLKLGG